MSLHDDVASQPGPWDGEPDGRDVADPQPCGTPAHVQPPAPPSRP